MAISPLARSAIVLGVGMSIGSSSIIDGSAVKPSWATPSSPPPRSMPTPSALKSRPSWPGCGAGRFFETALTRKTFFALKTRQKRWAWKAPPETQTICSHSSGRQRPDMVACRRRSASGNLIYAGEFDLIAERSVPEPATLALFGAGLTLIGMVRRRCRKSAGP
jgi:hypothetical protein